MLWGWARLHNLNSKRYRALWSELLRAALYARTNQPFVPPREASHTPCTRHAFASVAVQWQSPLPLDRSVVGTQAGVRTSTGNLEASAGCGSLCIMHPKHCSRRTRARLDEQRRTEVSLAVAVVGRRGGVPIGNRSARLLLGAISP